MIMGARAGLMVVAGIGVAVVLLLAGLRARGPRSGSAPGASAGVTADGRPILVTRGVKHLVPLEEVRGGGPPKDGIPPIDAPQFTTLPEVDPVLQGDGIGLAFVVGDEARFYPYQILVWHEIVNDKVSGTPVAITYCPLCFTGIVFDRRIGGEETTFGTSGKLWQSNLVMYDRASDSYWSQVTGEAIVGERTGTKLTLLPADTMPLRVFRERYPQGKVLTTDTGQRRDYRDDPYAGYATSRSVGFGVRAGDDRLHPKEVVMGFTLEGEAVAIVVKPVLERGAVTARVGNSEVVAQGDRAAQTVQVFRRGTDNVLLRLPAFPVFWFSWLAAHPNTRVIPEL